MNGIENVLKDLQTGNTTVADMVRNDYRTASVFKKYGIEFCCGGKWPLETACLINGIKLPDLLDELASATKDVIIPRSGMFNEWHPDFLIDYIVNVHHQYLKKAIPEANDMLASFATKHLSKYSYLGDVQEKFKKASTLLQISIEKEESTIFPYIRQLFHAYKNKESYAALLVKTLRKSFSDMVQNESGEVAEIFKAIREITNQYTPPPDGCVSHFVNFSLLKEVDKDTSQHLFLEQSVLFPKVIQIEKELLESPF